MAEGTEKSAPMRFPPPDDAVMDAIPDGCEVYSLYTPSAGDLPSFVSGEPHGDRIRARYFYRPADKTLLARAWFGPGTKGPKGFAHGGSMFSLLDEVMGGGCWAQGIKVLAVNVNINFRRSLPLGTMVEAESRVTRQDGRKVHVQGRMTDMNGNVIADATGLFLELSEAQKAAFKNMGEID
jgi:uncharacterized protein (TIGR00369 family)